MGKRKREPSRGQPGERVEFTSWKNPLTRERMKKSVQEAWRHSGVIRRAGREDKFLRAYELHDNDTDAAEQLQVSVQSFRLWREAEGLRDKFALKGPPTWDVYGTGRGGKKNQKKRKLEPALFCDAVGCDNRVPIVGMLCGSCEMAAEEAVRKSEVFRDVARKGCKSEHAKRPKRKAKESAESRQVVERTTRALTRREADAVEEAGAE